VLVIRTVWKGVTTKPDAGRQMELHCDDTDTFLIHNECYRQALKRSENRFHSNRTLKHRIKIPKTTHRSKLHILPCDVLSTEHAAKTRHRSEHTTLAHGHQPVKKRGASFWLNFVKLDV